MIGIMADSHDNVPAIKKAVRFFNHTKCELVIHAGDLVAPFSARELEALACPVKAVFGNCDGEKKGLKKAFRSWGTIREAPFMFHQCGLSFLVTHLHTSLSSYISSGKYDVIVFGHTHKPEIRRMEKTLLVNPGEAGGWLSGKSTVALLDCKTPNSEIVNL
ncbi:MAG: metallophosphoesterase [Candidatus Aminicenantes bacterium]